MILRLLAAGLAALLLLGTAPAVAAPAVPPVDIDRSVEGIATNGIPPRPAALRPRQTPLQGPPGAVQAQPAGAADGDGASAEPTGTASEGAAALPPDVSVAQVMWW